MYVIIIISKDPDIVGTTPIYVHYKRWMTLGSWTFFCIPLYGPQINCVLYSAQPHHARLCGFIKCWQRIFRHVCIYVCLYLCVYVYEILFLAHICMSGGILVSNVWRFGVEVLFCVLWFDDKSLNWFVPLLSRQRRVSNPWIEHKSIW